ncbi:MAG TPA: glycosyl hydrolase, partial [Phycisphaerae bacterium]|nr:glycosyl hydrolase [Phycisphaerae bacterium]
LPYLEKLFQRGALKYMDAVAVHPYQSPESVEQNVAELVALMKKHNGGKAKPIWATETSYMHDHTTQRVEAASHMVRMFTLLQTQPAVERIYWYLCCDYRKEFARLGLVHSDVDPMGKYTPVATYPAYANLVRRFHRAKFARREATDSRTRVYRFDKPGETLWVCWSTFETAELVLSAGGPVRRVSLVGGDETLAPTGGKIRVPVGETPFYLVAGEGVVTAVAETPRNDEVLADSARDFSGTQGAGGWSYFYYVSNQDGSAPYQPEKVQPMKWLPSPGDWADMWTGPAKWYTISAGGAQPAVLDGAQGWTVLRWTSDTDGPVHLIVKLRRGRNGDGVGCKIFLDGKEIHSKHLPPGATESIDLTPTVHKGSRVDFVVTPGPALDSNHDSATLRATILTPPKT